MSESHDILLDIVQDRAASTTDPVLNLRDNSTFMAEIEGNIDSVIVLTELGEDPREVVLLHVTDPTQAANIQRGDEVQFTLFGQTVQHVILKRRANSGNPQTDFWAAKIIEGMDD